MMCVSFLLLLAVSISFQLALADETPKAVSRDRWLPRRLPTTRIATFNAALVPFYPQLEDRADALAAEVKKSKVDVWCLQEFWFADEQRRFYNSVREIYPHTLSAINLNQSEYSDDEPACNSTSELEDCMVANNCNGSNQVETYICSVRSCTSIIANLSDECRGCVVFKIAEGVSSVQTCSTSEEKASRYEMTFGLMILSKKELSNTSVEGFNNRSQFRGFLQATVEGVGDLMCVHLSASSPPVYVGPPFTVPFLYSSYEQQQTAELDRISEFLSESTNPIVLGDFNHSPLIAGRISPLLSVLYGLMTGRLGLVSPYVTECGQCTWCGGNSTENMVAAKTNPSDLILDHIYLLSSSIRRVRRVKRVLDNVYVTTPTGLLPLSDHYGVMMELQDHDAECKTWFKKWFSDYTPLPCRTGQNLNNYLQDRQSALASSHLKQFCKAMV